MEYFKKYYLVYLLVVAAMTAAAMLTARQFESVAAEYEQSVCRTLIIDAGHGGEDGGAVSCTGVLESALNLEISLRLNDVCVLLGMDTVMVRTTDEAIYSEGCTTISEKKSSDLRNRVALVNATPDALLVSIHQNTFSDGKYAGAQVFYAPTDGSQTLAAQIQTCINSTVDETNHREEKPAQAVYLMKNIRCTGVLIECGFLSNVEEEARLRTATYQKRLVCALAAQLSQQLTEEKKDNEV